MNFLSHTLLLRLAALFLPLLLLPSCAAILEGTDDTIHVDTEPRGVTVLVDDEVLGITPCDIEVYTGIEEITLSHPEWGERIIETNPRFMYGYVLLDLLVTPPYGLSGILTDSFTGAYWDQPAVLFHDMTVPIDEQPAAAPRSDAAAPAR